MQHTFRPANSSSLSRTRLQHSPLARRSRPITRSQPRASSVCLPAWLCLLLSFFFTIARQTFAQTQSQTPPAGGAGTPASDDNDLGQGYPRLDDPWGKPAKLKTPPPPPPPPAKSDAQTAPDTNAPVATADISAPVQSKVRKNEVSASADFFLGQGNVTLPFGFSLAPLGIQPTVNSADRTSDYFGGTVSYSYKHTWYLDLEYANGSSSGNVPIAISSSSLYPKIQSNFSIKDDYYQAYLRYAFPGLRGKRISAYLRAGFSYVQANITDAAPIPGFGIYQEADKTDDILGNVGFGVTYRLYTTRHVRLGIQAEGEGFYGRRTQDINEALPQSPQFVLPPTSINNSLYGGIGRGTLRFEYIFSQALNAFADGGIQAKYTLINYPSGLGSFNELLWGPYIKIGVRYSF